MGNPQNRQRRKKKYKFKDNQHAKKKQKLDNNGGSAIAFVHKVLIVGVGIRKIRLL